MIFCSAVHTLSRFAIGIVICVAALRQVKQIAFGVGCVPVGPYCGETAHCLIPSGSGNIHFGAGIKKYGLREIVPWTSKPHGSLGRIAGSSDCAVAEHISPLHILAVGRSDDKSARIAGDEQRGILHIDVAAIVDEVDSTLYERVFHICAIGRLAGSNPCVLVGEHGYIVEDSAVARCIERKCLRTVFLLMSIGILYSDILE